MCGAIRTQTTPSLQQYLLSLLAFSKREETKIGGEFTFIFGIESGRLEGRGLVLSWRGGFEVD